MSISPIAGGRADIQQMIDKIRDVSSKSKAFQAPSGIESAAKTHDFSKIFESASKVVGNISDMQTQSQQMKDKLLQGDPSVSMADVVVATEKSKLAVEGLIIVRNKCLEAYKEIMNMPA